MRGCLRSASHFGNSVFPCTVTLTIVRVSDEIRIQGVAILVEVPFSSFAAQTF